MAVWEKVTLDVDGAACEALAPVIISASRSTDIPAFYADWLMRRLEEGFAEWVNPFNGKRSWVSFAKARLFVFWTKNPKPLFAHLEALDRRGLNSYFHFTLNDYEDEGLEPGVPPLAERIATFIELSERVGKERVIWRFDPLLLTDRITVDRLLAKVEKIGDQLQKHTTRLVFSFADIGGYDKVRRNLGRGNVRYREFDEASMRTFAQGLAEMNRRWRLDLASCAEGIDLADLGIEHNRCVDDRLIARLFKQDCELMTFLGRGPGQGSLFGADDDAYRRLKDKGQRPACGCIVSKDIGAYNTCPHLCAYCYANANREAVLGNYERGRAAPWARALGG